MIFWTLVVAFTVLWYLLITVLVAYRGGRDIRQMIKRLTDAKYHDNQV